MGQSRKCIGLTLIVFLLLRSSLASMARSPVVPFLTPFLVGRVPPTKIVQKEKSGTKLF